MAVKKKIWLLALCFGVFLATASKAEALVKNYGPCQLTIASWDKPVAAKGDVVTLRVIAKGECIGKSVNWDISNTSPDPVSVNLLVVGGITTWMPAIDGQYTFTASLTDGSGQVTSGPLSVSGVNGQTTYYVDPTGNNSSSGTSQASAWSDFTNLTSRVLLPGERVLLKRGGTWNQQLTISGKGNGNNFIEVGAYGTGARPKICRGGAGVNGQRSVKLLNPSYMKVSSLEVCNGDAGIMLNYNNSYDGKSVYFSDIVAHDFTGHYESAGEIGYSYGIGFSGASEWAPHTILKDFRVMDSEFYKNNVGIWISWLKDAQGHGYFSGAFSNAWVKNVYIHDNNWTNGTYAGIAVSTCTACQFTDIVMDKATFDAGSGTSAVFFGGSYHGTFDRVAILRTPPPPVGPDGTALDFESWSHGMVIENSWFEENAAGAMEYFQNGGDSYNTQIKNNVFVNNGYSRYFGSGQAQIVISNWPGTNMSYGNIFNNWYSYTMPNPVPFFSSDLSPARFFMCDNNAAYVYPLGASQTPTACGANTNISGTPATFPTTNLPPVVSLTSPSDGSIYAEETGGGAIIPVSASASDPDGSIVKVEFALAGTYQTSYNYASAPGSQFYRWEMQPPCVDTTPPYDTSGCNSGNNNWSRLYTDRIDTADPEKIWVVAKATDNLGYTTTSWSSEVIILKTGSIVLPTLTPTVTPAGKMGDANLDGKVDGLDYMAWLVNYNSLGGGVSKGDFNSDGKTDGLDYVVWLTNYGK